MFPRSLTMPDLPPPNRWTPRLLMVAAAACAALAACRVWNVVSWTEPSLVITSGCEEEALFSIWKFIHGQEVYADPAAIPYAASYFNFIFYKTYGLWTKLGLALPGLDEAWLPTIARCLTLLIVFANVLVFRQLVKEGELAPEGFGRAALWAVALIPFLNPMAGLWIFTVRPDWLAVLLELLALLWLMRYDRQGGIGRLLIACGFLYAAWATKQTAIAVVVAWCLVNLCKKHWRGVALVAGVLLPAFGLTLALGGPAYVHSVVTSQRHMDILPAQAVHLLLGALQENPLFGVALVAWLCFGWRLRCNFRARPMQLLSWCLAISTLWAFVTSMKAASNTNYYYLAGALSLLWLLGQRRAARSDFERFDPGWWTGCLLLIALVVKFACGGSPKDTLDFAHEQAKARALTARLRALPGPALVTTRAANLPWIQPHAPHFVVATAYPYDRRGGVTFQRGGLAGLVASGYFNVIAIPKDEPTTTIDDEPTTTIDGAPLTRYRLESDDRYFTYYLRRPSP
jgi:hypothetical protein